MIIAWCYVGGKWTKHIVGGFVTHSFLQYDIRLDLIKGNMPWSFYHHLASHFSSNLGELTIQDQFLDLGAVK